MSDRTRHLPSKAAPVRRAGLPQALRSLAASHLLGAMGFLSATLGIAVVAVPASAHGGDETTRDTGVVTLKEPGSEEVRILAGTFSMGSDEIEIARALMLCEAERGGEDCEEQMFADEFPRHQVYLDAYWIDRHEVSVAAYERCVEAGPCAPRPLAGGARFTDPTLPATLVSHREARAYCEWMGKRLPTEAEWERAARGVDERRYPWGNVYNPYILNHGAFSWDPYDDSDGYAELAPIRSFVAGATPDGIQDLAGNAEEWVADYYATQYPAADQANPKGPDVGDERVVRGGGFIHGRPWVRAAARGHDLPSSRRAWRGFRCARD